MLEWRERQKSQGLIDKPLTSRRLQKAPFAISLERSVDQAGKCSIEGPVDREVCQGHGGSHSQL